MADDPFFEARKKMVSEQLEERGIRTRRILDAFMRVPRELFVPAGLKDSAYSDKPLAFSEDVTISQPYIVAYMIEKLDPKPEDRVLDVGTGSGYALAILSQLCSWVYSVDIDSNLVQRAHSLLDSLAIKNVSLEARDGFGGWSEHAPYDCILVSAAPATVPRELISEIAPGGRAILPLGDEDQELILFEKTSAGLQAHEVGPVRFVPMRRKSRAH